MERVLALPATASRSLHSRRLVPGDCKSVAPFFRIRLHRHLVGTRSVDRFVYLHASRRQSQQQCQHLEALGPSLGTSSAPPDRPENLVLGRFVRDSLASPRKNARDNTEISHCATLRHRKSLPTAIDSRPNGCLDSVANSICHETVSWSSTGQHVWWPVCFRRRAL